MSKTLQELLTAAGLTSASFPTNSRYHGSDLATYIDQNGESKVYLKRRFVPAAEKFSLLQTHSVEQGDRIDNVANTYLNDPEQYWRLCDANNAMHPDELTEKVGNKIRITLPEGVPGVEDA